MLLYHNSFVDMTPSQNTEQQTHKQYCKQNKLYLNVFTISSSSW